MLTNVRVRWIKTLSLKRIYLVVLILTVVGGDAILPRAGFKPTLLVMPLYSVLTITLLRIPYVITLSMLTCAYLSMWLLAWGVNADYYPVCMRSLYCCIVACAHLGNGTGRRTATMSALLLLTSGLVRHETVLHSCVTSPEGGGGYRLVIVHTHGDFIVLPHWNTSYVIVPYCWYSMSYSV